MSTDDDFISGDLSAFLGVEGTNHDEEFDPADLTPFIDVDGTINSMPDIANVSEGLRLMMEYAAKHRRKDPRFAKAPEMDTYRSSVLVGFPFDDVEPEMQQKLNFLGWGGDSLSGTNCQYLFRRTGR